ncbi:MAG TPA: hypothetical protein VMO52_00805 [Acidimicrobiia bacterium]|nr:hypothetical protein [Acidimicrobiia bacterium]
MRRLVVTVALLMILPPSAAFAVDLDELLEESRSAAYSAEQLISCTTPDGIRDALIELEQQGGEVRYGGTSETGPQVWSGFGGWVVQSDGSVVESAATADQPDDVGEPTYVVEERDETSYLGRASTQYALLDGDLARAELVVDNETGVLMSVTTFDSDGNPYCERRFVSYDPQAPDWTSIESGASQELAVSTTSDLPSELSGFTLLDSYVDDAGLTFGYYSDGFFSFAVFESTVEIVLDGGVEYVIDGRVYQREFTPGQVTYTWPVQGGGMALIGDLPPDMHDAGLNGLPAPYDTGFFRRLWRSLFG